MSGKDMRIVGRVRGILGKHFIELDELRISCVRGDVRILGTLKRMKLLEDRFPITDKFINDLKHEIKRIKDVRHIRITDKGEGDEA